MNRLAALRNVLVPPRLWARVAAARQVLVVPDGSLYLLPFESLVVTPGADAATTRFWLDVGPVVRYAASATFIQQLNRRNATRVAPSGARPGALSVSDPVYGGDLARLPGTTQESSEVAEALHDVADVMVLRGAAAREPAVREAVAGKRYVHVATHGLIDQKGGDLFASLALTAPESRSAAGDDDGFLQLFEIYDLPLTCDLAVLSACSSNVGHVVTGEGVFALSRGFLVAGARRVIASQWAVDDASTAELVGDLFRAIAAAEKAGEPVDTARALRDAKRKIRGKSEWASPFFWAPFVLTGVE
jgi:CHAT domain-containing protein